MVGTYIHGKFGSMVEGSKMMCRLQVLPIVLQGKLEALGGHGRRWHGPVGTLIIALKRPCRSCSSDPCL